MKDEMALPPSRCTLPPSCFALWRDKMEDKVAHVGDRPQHKRGVNGHERTRTDNGVKREPPQAPIRGPGKNHPPPLPLASSGSGGVWLLLTRAPAFADFLAPATGASCSSSAVGNVRRKRADILSIRVPGPIAKTSSLIRQKRGGAGASDRRSPKPRRRAMGNGGLKKHYHFNICQLRLSASARSSSEGATTKGCPTLDNSGMSAALSP